MGWIRGVAGVEDGEEGMAMRTEVSVVDSGMEADRRARSAV